MGDTSSLERVRQWLDDYDRDAALDREAGDPSDDGLAEFSRKDIRALCDMAARTARAEVGDHAELVERLRKLGSQHLTSARHIVAASGRYPEPTVSDTIEGEAADTITALAAERDKWRTEAITAQRDAADAFAKLSEAEAARDHLKRVAFDSDCLGCRMQERLNAMRGALDFDGELDACLNLSGAIIDIEHQNGRCDDVALATLKRVEGQLGKAAQALSASEAEGKPTLLDPREEEGCRCQGCGARYRVDVMVPDALWDKIKPAGKAKGAGLLCGRCIGDRIEARGEFDAFDLMPVDEAAALRSLTGGPNAKLIGSPNDG